MENIKLILTVSDFHVLQIKFIKVHIFLFLHNNKFPFRF